MRIVWNLVDGIQRQMSLNLELFIVYRFLRVAKVRILLPLIRVTVCFIHIEGNGAILLGQSNCISFLAFDIFKLRHDVRFRERGRFEDASTLVLRRIYLGAKVLMR